jgi:hypothetical protein
MIAINAFGCLCPSLNFQHAADIVRASIQDDVVSDLVD